MRWTHLSLNTYAAEYSISTPDDADTQRAPSVTLPPPPPALDNNAYRSGPNVRPASRSSSPPAQQPDAGRAAEEVAGGAASKRSDSLRCGSGSHSHSLPNSPLPAAGRRTRGGGGDREAGEIPLAGSDFNGKRRRHPPIVWDPSVPVRPSKRSSGAGAGAAGPTISAAGRAAQELDDFRSRTGHDDDDGYDPDGSPMLKRSPSHSGASNGSGDGQAGAGRGGGGSRPLEEGSEGEEEGGDGEGAQRQRSAAQTGTVPPASPCPAGRLIASPLFAGGSTSAPFAHAPVSYSKRCSDSGRTAAAAAAAWQQQSSSRAAAEQQQSSSSISRVCSTSGSYLSDCSPAVALQ
ncbi:MAG: hypothetical protein WDW36_009940 [Sanguina aurantia]